MDVFFAYLLIATSTPLFLWKERQKLAIMHIPVIVVMWVVFILNMNADYGMTGDIIFVLAYVVNVIIAHMTVFHLFVVPFFKMMKTPKSVIH